MRAEFVAVDDRDAVAVAGEDLAGRLSDAAGAPGDDGGADGAAKPGWIVGKH
jgi:hypothetical protein